MTPTPARNRLASEKSPYLLQHASNPVDWYPWGEEAFARARREDRPIFLSIGYSTCHWCHVMERESFEDPEVAALLNDGFVAIKVDREERPDVDAVYMTVCQMLTGHGGWPLTILMTPEREPFFAATYIPKESRHGRIGMVDLLPRLRTAWKERREELVRSAREVVAVLAKASEGAEEEGAGAELGEAVLHEGFRQLRAAFDGLQGGFGGSPKFPIPHHLFFLLRYWRRYGEAEALEMVERTLEAMRRGGIYDHVGFGFHRYSTDARWSLPHFEKMLYDQALLALAYLEAFRATGRREFERTAREVFTYVLRDLRDEGGAFHAAEDADSEGREGAFYLWTASEIDEVLGEEDGELARRVFDVRIRGNFAEESTGAFTGENVLHLTKPLPVLAADLGLSAGELETRLEGIRRRLFEVRQRRARPLKDDKVLTDWNGWMIAALAAGARTLEDDRYRMAAAEAAEFVLRELRDAEGRLLHRYRDGEAAICGTADDHAGLAWGLLELFETTGDPRWLEEALRLAERLVEDYEDPKAGGFFTTARHVRDLPVRRKEIYDGAVPSANSVALHVLHRLGSLTGDPRWDRHATRVEQAFSTAVRRAPVGQTFFLSAFDARLGPSDEVVIVGPQESEETAALLRAVHGGFFPRCTVLWKRPGAMGARLSELAPFVAPHDLVHGHAAAYVCRARTCRLPTTVPDELRAALEEPFGPHGGTTDRTAGPPIRRP